MSKQKNKRILKPHELDQLLKTIDSKKYKMLIEVTLNHGLRNKEAVSLKRKDIDLREKQIEIREGKGRKDRSVPIAQGFVNKLRNYVKDLQWDDYLFPSPRSSSHISTRTFRRRIRGYALEAGLYPDPINDDNLEDKIPYEERIVPHSLRHTYATQQLRNGTKMEKVSRLLGHESVQITIDNYEHMNIEDTRDEVNEFYESMYS